LNARMRSLSLACIVTLLSACGGGGAVPAIAPGSAQPAKPGAKLHVSMRVKIPHMPRHASGRARRPFFVAASVAGIAVDVYPHGNHATAIAAVNADVSATSSLCQSAGAARECRVPIPVPAGNLDFVVTAYDAPPAGGSFSGAKKLAIGETTTTIATGAVNNVAISLGGIVAGIAISPSLLSVRAIAPSTQNVAVTAVDADGDAIISDGYVDATGAPAAITLAADSSAGATVTFAPASLSSPSPAGVLVTYAASKATSAQIQSGFASTITASAAGVAGTAKLTSAPPVTTPYSVPAGPVYPFSITSGPDKALWFTTLTADNIGRSTTSGAFSQSGTTSSSAEQIAAGSDGAMWFTEGNGAIGRFAVSSPGTVTEIAPPAVITFAAGITAGPSGDAASMWFTDPVDGLIARIPTASPSTGSISIYGPVAGVIQPGGITTANDGNLWFSDCTSGGIGKISPTSPTGTGAQITEFAIPPQASGGPSPQSIVQGPDGALWFGDPTNGDDGQIGRITTAGSIEEFATSAGAYGVAVGPDGAIWFTEPSINHVGRIDPTTHTIVEFPTHGDGPYGITLGPDGALYVADYQDDFVERIQ
jgi:virginiamycin B lyase